MKRPATDKAIIFDRDGVINDIVMRGNVVSSPRSFSEFKVRDEFVELYEKIDPRRYSIFVVSNQPDVARGLLAESELRLMTESLLDRFAFAQILYCEHDDEASCKCRKPRPGMLLSILAEFSFEPSDAIIVGDSGKDIAAGIAAGVTTFYLQREYNTESSNFPKELTPNFTINRLPQIIPILEAMP